MGIFSLLVTIVMYLTETLYFRAATLNFYVVFPCVLNCELNESENELTNVILGVTLGGLVYLPTRLRIWDPSHDCDDENVQLLRQAGAMKRRRHCRKNN